MAEGGKFGFEIEIRDGKAIADLTQLSARLKEVEKVGTTAGTKTAASFASQAKSFAAAAAGSYVLMKAWQGLTSLGRTALKNAAEQVEANAQLEYMYGANAAALIKQASALQIVTKFGDDQIQNAQFALGTFKLTADAVEKLTPAILDFAEAKKVDAKTAADLFGKAMTGNIGLLGRYGISLSETQKQILQTGTEEQKVAVITQELGSRFAGVAEAMNRTVPGAVASLKKAWGEVLESQGMLIQGSEKIRVGIQSVANQMYAMGGNAELAAEQTDKFAMSIADTAIVSAESLRGIIGFAKTALNVVQIMQLATPAGIMAAGGNLRTLTLEIGENIKDAEKGMDDYGGKFVEVLRNARSEMAKSKGGVIPIPRGMPGGAPGAAAGGKGVGPSGYTDEQFAEEVAKWEAMDAQIADTDFAWAVTRLERQEQLTQDFADRQFEAEVRAWEERDRMAEEHARAHGELAGRYLGFAIDATGQGLADTIVDGKAAWNDLWKNALKGAVAMTAEMLIQLAIAKAIGAAIGGATGGPVGAFVGALFHEGGMIDRYHSGGTIPRAHNGMYTGRLRRDEVPIIAQTGEAVLNRSATRRIGGRSGVDALNRGGGIGGGVNITINASAGQSPQAIADSVGRELMRRSRRGEIVLNARGLEQ